jgi:NitT/TauT family transport system permease protein
VSSISHTVASSPADANRSMAASARRAARRRVASVWAARIGFAVVVIGGWQAFTTWGIVDPFFYGQPSGIWKRTIDLFEHGSEFGSFWVDIETTLEEAVYGFLLGSAAGIVLGVSLGQNRFLAEVLGPYIKVVNAIPRIVLGSIFIIAFGVGTTPKILLAAVLVFFVVFFNAFQGVREVDRNILANARVLGASRPQIIRHVVLPSALTWIITSLHTAFGFAIVGALVGEVLGAQHGIGLVIRTAQGDLDQDAVFAGMFVVAVITLIAEFLITALEKRLLSWRPPSSSDTGGPTV